MSAQTGHKGRSTVQPQRFGRALDDLVACISRIEMRATRRPHILCLCPANLLLVTCAAMLPLENLPDAKGHFGRFGGMFVPETLMTALLDLTAEYEKAKVDPTFHAELDGLLRDYCGRPTPLYFAERLTQQLGGAKIYLKREDLLHTGAHKINNTIGQILLAKRMKKPRL